MPMRIAATVAAITCLTGAPPARAQGQALPTSCGGPIQIVPPPSARPPPILLNLADGRACAVQCPSPAEPSGPPGEIIIADNSRTETDGSLFSTRLTYDAGLRVYVFRQSTAKTHQPARDVTSRIACEGAATAGR